MNARPTIGFATTLAAALLMTPPSFGAAAAGAATGRPGTPYTSASIVSPADGEGWRANSGNLAVRAETQPELLQGHRLRLLLDGNAQSPAQASPAFRLTGVERGEHQLRLQIVDDDGTLVFEGESSAFHLLRHSKLHPRPAANP